MSFALIYVGTCKINCLQILESEGRLSEAADTLTEYYEKHPNNFYAAMSLYRFYKRHDYAIDVMLPVLEASDDVCVLSVLL